MKDTTTNMPEWSDVPYLTVHIKKKIQASRTDSKDVNKIWKLEGEFAHVHITYLENSHVP